MEALVTALAPVFAAGLAIQQLLELLDPIVTRVVGDANKKIGHGILSLIAGLALAFGAGLRVLGPLGGQDFGPWDENVDKFVTGLIISGGTQGINSIMKFMGYAKEGKKAEAAAKMEPVKNKAKELSARA